ncbi:DMT family transporter [Neptunicoccus cionae]|uniref:Transporter n=1 Tax=Neptunicoccus cionae TaxID=2035344 RepID=A0A916VPM1_9RHOB|nr:DMT family transporter [Amylibacter cionae]GGA14482.1 transporter [Amylibacter cionae]
MEKKDRVDALGASLLVGVSLLLGLNQVLVKIVAQGMHPALQAGLRSAIAVIPVLALALLFRRKLTIRDGSLNWGVIAGVLFALEFLMLFLAIDYSSVARVSVLFYTMPVWMTLGAHFLIKEERLTRNKIIGLVLAVTGVVVAMWGREGGENELLGDIFCIAGAMIWAGVGLVARVTPLNRSVPEMQLLYQLVVSAIVLIPVAFLIGDQVRALEPFHWGVLTFQAVVVVGFGFSTWFWVLSKYPASDMASFGFLAPLFGVLLGWLMLRETITVWIVAALVLVSAGIVLINYKPRKR